MATAGLSENTMRERQKSAGSTCCSRCRGLMVVEDSFDSIAGGDHAGFQVRRCVQCGDVIDQVILEHRRSQLRNDLSRTYEGERL